MTRADALSEPIEKLRPAHGVAPNLTDYAAERARFTWEDARRRLDGLPGGRGLHIAHEAVDRHARGARQGRVAIRWRGRHRHPEGRAARARRPVVAHHATPWYALDLHPDDILWCTSDPG